ncbi:MAG: pre-peptidase C-terminal domain-containing protein [Gammaproteobacteria bacterium]|nr:pre-peptidase C-terminal domain-containing protein [Gammaproteobacteria bacterium]
MNRFHKGAIVSLLSMSMLALPVKAENLFSAATTQSTLTKQKGESDVRLVKLNRDLVSAKSTTLTFNLSKELNAVAKRSSVQTNQQGSLVWQGKFASSNKKASISDNSVILIKRVSGVTGTIRYQGKLYKLRPAGAGNHELVLMDEANMPEDHPPGDMSVLEQKSSFNFEQLMSQAPTPSATPELKILVAYTAAARNAVSDIQGLIELAVAETNTGYNNSNVDATMTLVHTYEVNYSESNFNTDLRYFRQQNDGVMDEVHGKRDQYGADLAVIITNVNDYCGLASDIGATSSTAFAAVYHGCATGYYSFGHEVGHLQAARHDPSNDPTNSPYAFGHGYQYSQGGWRTIMAYNCSGGCTRINWWSNPEVTRSGVPMGTTTRSNNARVLNLTAATIANFKGDSTPPPPPPPPGEQELTNGVTVSSLSGSQGSEKEFYLDVPSSASTLNFVLNGGSGDADLYVKFGSPATTSNYDCRPYRNGNNETCDISNVQAGRYYVMLRGYSSYSGTSLTGTYTEGPAGGTFSRSNLSDTRGDWQHFAVQIPAGMSSFTINMSGGSGDADLYVNKGSQSTTSNYDCRPYRNGNSESCSFNNPGADTWYISVRAYSNYSGVNINAEWE